MTGFTYKSYSFVEKDPIIDEVRTVFQQSGETYSKLEELSGVTRKTLSNWFDGPTRRPQAATINAVLRALGYKLAAVPISQAQIVEPTPAPQYQYQEGVRHVVQVHKYRRK